MSEPEDPSSPEIPSFRQLLFRGILFLLILLAGYLVLFFTVRPQLLALSLWFAEHLGWGGVFFSVFLVDTFIVPATADILFPITRNWAALPLLFIMSFASILGGFSGYLIGRNLGNIRGVRKMTAYYQQRGEQLIRKSGIWAVAAAGFTPIPYSTVSWIAGMLKLPPHLYLLGSLSRIPRFILYYLAFHQGLEHIGIF